MVRDDCPLTPREHTVVLHAMAGHDAWQTARALGISASTVRTHRLKALRRLRVDSMARAAMVVLREGWVSREGLVPDYKGPAYSVAPVKPWMPSPAQRLYLDAFDRMLALRTDRAVDDVEFCFSVLVHESGSAGGRVGRPDLDGMLLSMARACLVCR